MKTTTERDYLFQAAGRFWVIPELTLTELPDGSLGLAQQEADRVHRAIANEVCGKPVDLNALELEFLCDVTGVLYTEVADLLAVHKSTVTKWRQAGAVPHLASLALKKTFWFRLFGAQLEAWQVPVGRLEDEEAFLALARREAIEQELVGPVVVKAA